MSPLTCAGRGPPDRERGSVSIVAIGVMATIVVLAVASSDVARVLAAASRAQSAADAAALAAAQELALPSGGETPQQQAAAYAARNGAELVSCRCDPGQSDAVVEVRAAVGRLLLFGDARVVVARARAVVDESVSATHPAFAWMSHTGYT